MVPVVETQRKQFTVDEYHQMIASGVFQEDDRVELIEGEIFRMSPIGPRHTSCVNKLNRWFSSNLGERAIVSVQNPVQVRPLSEPQPDLALLRPRADFYASEHPGPKDILLVIEVSDTTQDYDRGVKIPSYARAGIREAWLVDLKARRLEVYREPRRGVYRKMTTLDADDTVRPLAFPRVRLEVTRILP